VEKSSKAPVTNNHKSSPSVNTNSTDRTVKPTPLHKKSPSAELTPEEHLEIGIEAHDSGATNKSTYHLRLAAMAGLPTAMLLYALACRHGWGMRPNQAEGVKWLRKAIDTAGLDVAEAEEKLNAGKKKLDPIERKKRKAQYALAIYELGISSMNGWGCTKDKALAVRCYEIAGNWGDADALAEAAFCYTQGVGVKKDLHKAASLYRQAADKGMSMAGNSWWVATSSDNFEPTN
jgi:TPR repeat protein